MKFIKKIGNLPAEYNNSIQWTFVPLINAADAAVDKGKGR